MGTTETIIIIALLAAVGWFIWTNPLVQTGVKLGTDPRVIQLGKDVQSGKYSKAELDKRAQALAQDYKKEMGMTNYAYELSRPYAVGLY